MKHCHRLLLLGIVAAGYLCFPSFLMAKRMPKTEIQRTSEQTRSIKSRFAKKSASTTTASISDYYDFSASSGTFISIQNQPNTDSVGTGPLLADDATSSSIPIGFPFNYGGVEYSRAAVCTNGWISFDSLTISTTNGYLAPNNLSHQEWIEPYLAPFFGDILVNGNIYYATTGSSPDRIFTVEWNNVAADYNYESLHSLSFQVKLYEVNGKIEFVYSPGPDAASTFDNPSGSGLCAGIVDSSLSFYGISDLSTSAMASVVSENDQLNVPPTDGLTFAFIPIGTAQHGIALAGSDVVARSASLNGMIRTDGANVSTYFLFGRSLTALNDSVAATPFSTTTDSTGITGSITGLSPATQYYYCVATTINGSYRRWTYAAFTTGDIPRGVVEAASNIIGNSATLNGRIRTDGTSVVSYFLYGTDSNHLTDSVATTPASTVTDNTVVSATVLSLAQLTTYYFCISTVANGEYVRSTTSSFVSGISPTIPPGDGTVGSPYLISSLQNLYWLSQEVNGGNSFVGKHFQQTADINAGPTAKMFYFAEGDFYNGWVAIGYYDYPWSNSHPFSGTYDGNGKIIDSLYLNRPTSPYQGLFGNLVDAQVMNLRVTNIRIYGGLFCGGLTASAESTTIANCHTSGMLQCDAYSGGLAGELWGLVNVSNSSSSCSLTSTGPNAYSGFGGFMSEMQGRGGSIIQNCFSTGNVNGGNDEFTGGFGAFLYGGTIKNCYSTGNVTNSSEYVGGFLGGVQEGSVVNCYSVGTVSSSTVANIGGFIGGDVYGNGVYSACFWDTETSGQPAAMPEYSGSDVSGRGTSTMKTQSTFTDAGWNFSTVWEMNGSNYPNLISNPNSALPVELSSFAATSMNGNAHLAWSTVSESNNAGFEIERRRVAGQNSEFRNQNTWTKIGFVEGNGTSNEAKSFAFTDRNLVAGTYAYRLKQIDKDGSFKYSQSAEVAISAPTELALGQNYPNPFNPSTIIRYQLPVTAHCSLAVYDLLGRQVASLVNEVKEAGSYTAAFDGSKLASGVYLYTLQTGSITVTKKLLLMK